MNSTIPIDLPIQQRREMAMAMRGKTMPTPPPRKPVPIVVQHKPITRTIPRTPQEPGVMRWAYGVTTVPSRVNDLFPQTLESLKAAGFPEPMLFVDDCRDRDKAAYDKFGLPVLARFPKIRTVGNWMLSMWELYIRNPCSDRYVIFQDDFVTYRNLREYLERSGYPDRSYLNLYTMPSNQTLVRDADKGWFKSNQMGRSAIALVFNRDALRTLLSHPHMLDKPVDPHRGHKAMDGAICESMKNAGYTEYCHNPSLTQHTGLVSSMQNTQHPLAKSFRGVDYNALDLL